MTELPLLRNNGRYLACVSFTGSMLDSEVISVSVGSESTWTGQAGYSSGYSFSNVSRFNEAFMPVFEGTPGYSLWPTGVPVVYGLCEKDKWLSLGAHGEHVMGKFLTSNKFDLFNEKLGALPCLRAMKSKTKGWSTYLLETDEDIQTTLSIHDHVYIRRQSNTWMVFQGQSGEFFLTNNYDDEEGIPIGMIITERGGCSGKVVKVLLGSMSSDQVKDLSAMDALSCIRARA